jgi:hypothetical protein
MYDRTQKKSKKSIIVVVNGKEWDKESIKELIQTNDIAVYRALVLLYSFQTDEEKNTDKVKTVNGKGFNKLDAEILSSMARQVKSGRHLTDKQMYVARPKLMKYAGQILNYMKTREEQKTLANA